MQQREFPDWEQLYQQQQVESMPWFNPTLDPDLDQALMHLNLQAGSMLDLGTGPATQALELAKRGFQVTATDLSAAAIAQAQTNAKEQGLEIDFRQDDILNSQLKQQFEFIFDRGCFHVLPPEQRQNYVTTVSGLLQPQSYLFLKCFSVRETREAGPYRFTPDAIESIFSPFFQVRSIKETVYQGTLDPLPQALFCVLQR